MILSSWSPNIRDILRVERCLLPKELQRDGESTAVWNILKATGEGASFLAPATIRRTPGAQHTAIQCVRLKLWPVLYEAVQSCVTSCRECQCRSSHSPDQLRYFIECRCRQKLFYKIITHLIYPYQLGAIADRLLFLTIEYLTRY